MRAWREDLRFRDLIEHEPAVTRLLSKERLKKSFALDRQLKNVDLIFYRVLGSGAAASKQAPDNGAKASTKSAPEKKSSAKKSRSSKGQARAAKARA